MSTQEIKTTLIIVEGDLSIKNNIKDNKPDDKEGNENKEEDFLIILVDGDIETNMHIESNLFMYSTGTITISNNPGGNSNGNGNPGKFDMNGSIMAEEGIIIEDMRNQGLKLNHTDKFLIKNNYIQLLFCLLIIQFLI